MMAMPMDETSLIFRHLPVELSKDERKDFLFSFGASRVNLMGTRGPLKNTAFAVFPDRAHATEVLHQLHQADMLGSTLVVEFAKGHDPDTPSLLDGGIQGSGDKVKDSKLGGTLGDSGMERRKTEAREMKFDATFGTWGLKHPRRPELRYAYPPPTPPILSNIMNALAALPKFYVQVLHLMNKMDLPSPFGNVTPAPPLTTTTTTSTTTNVLPVEVGQTEMDISDEESESESELESEEEIDKAHTGSLESKEFTRAQVEHHHLRRRKALKKLSSPTKTKRARLSKSHQDSSVIRSHLFPPGPNPDANNPGSVSTSTTSISTTGTGSSLPIQQVFDFGHRSSESTQGGGGGGQHRKMNLNLKLSATGGGGGGGGGGGTRDVGDFMTHPEEEQLYHHQHQQPQQQQRRQNMETSQGLKMTQSSTFIPNIHLPKQQELPTSSLSSTSSTALSSSSTTLHAVATTTADDKITAAEFVSHPQHHQQHHLQQHPALSSSTPPAEKGGDQQDESDRHPQGSGFGTIQSAPKRDSNQPTGEGQDSSLLESSGQDAVGTDRHFISSSELRRGRLTEQEMQESSVFRRYDPGEASCRLYVKNVAKQATEEDLRYIFGRYVDWKSQSDINMFDIRLMKEGRMKGQAFVTLPSQEVASLALSESNGFRLKDKSLVVQFARTAKASEDPASVK